MSLEIYYTSAPQGLKEGSRGFCTVAASEGVPKPLWDRLESLSGYRHHYEVGNSAGRNPAVWAHWLLHIGGGEYHVLSRIADAGVDYTHRSNAFAHHVVLEASELAAGGPAWMLMQPGTVQEQWDGVVGPIVRSSPLPHGSGSAGPCRHWQQLTGDAGWAGVLADAFVASPWKPVCILFSEDQDLLPLLDEAIRLLPPASRWQVTFNTYFTSAPASAVCSWRCCLAGTRAADQARRQSASGLILDLTDLKNLGTPRESKLVALARSGGAPTPAAAPMPATQPKRAKSKRGWFGGEPAIIPLKDEAAAPKPVPADEPIELAPLPPMDAAPAASPPRAPQPRFRRSLLEELADASRQRAPQPEPRPKGRRILGMVVGAAPAVAAGGWLLHMANKMRPTPPVEPVTPRSTPAQNPVAPPPATSVVIVAVAPPSTTEPATQETVAPTEPVRPPDVTPLEPPQPIVLAMALERPATGAGISDRSQTITVPPAQWDVGKPITALSMLLAGDRAEYVLKNGSHSGTLMVVDQSQGQRPGLVLRWRGEKDAAAADVLAVQLDTMRSRFEITWRTALVMRRPDVARLAYWIGQNSQFKVADSDASRPQQVRFKAFEPQPADPAAAVTAFRLPCELPPGVLPAVENLPDGWTAKTQDVRGGGYTVQLTSTNPVNHLETLVTLAISADLSEIRSNLAGRRDVELAELARSERELKAAEDEIARLRADYETDVAEAEKRLALVPDDLVRYKDLRQAGLNVSLDAPTKKRSDFQLLCKGYNAAVEQYAQLTAFDVVLKLPDGLALVRLPFRSSR